MVSQSVTTIETLESKSTTLQLRVEELQAELQITKDSAVSVEVIQELDKVKRERDDLMHALQTTEEDFDSLRIERDQLQKKVEELEVEVTTGAGVEGEDDELAALKKKLGDLEEEHRACGEVWTKVEGEDGQADSSRARLQNKTRKLRS
jgi:chromosome segregation ATPase